MKKAFTLAEILITLAIIGIVAALAIPAVLANAQQQEYKTGLKKAVSVLNQAVMTNLALDDETPLTNNDLYEFLKRHMSVIKTATFSSCYSKSGVSSGMVADKDGKQNCGGDSSAVQNKVFYTTDGMRFEFASRSGGKSTILLHEDGTDLLSRDTEMGNCGSLGLNANPNKTKKMPCVIMVDVNGDKGPSKPTGESAKDAEGKSTGTTNILANYVYPKPNDNRVTDVFTLIVTESKVIPFGVSAQRAMYTDKRLTKKEQNELK